MDFSRLNKCQTLRNGAWSPLSLTAIGNVLQSMDNFTLFQDSLGISKPFICSVSPCVSEVQPSPAFHLVQLTLWLQTLKEIQDTELAK
jgi:hypothetical protein